MGRFCRVTFLVRRVAWAPLALGLVLAASPAGAQQPEERPASPVSGPLPELPKMAAITHTEPDPGVEQELARTLDRLTSEDERTRASARASLAEAPSSMVPAIRHRIQELRGSLDRDAAPRMLEEARKAGRKALEKKKPASASKGKDKPKEQQKDDADEEGDWLDFMLASPRPKDSTWRDLVHLLAMERLLTTVGTTPAVRELIQLHAYFGDLLRIDLQRQVQKLKDRAVPALIEARQHDAKIIQRWANRQLDSLGRAIPGEAVATSDPQVLADVLRAYGRTRDVDSVRVLLSFCNSDRIQLREAAREAVAAVGEPGVWQLRDAYLGLTGNKPPKDWNWERVARELFALYDRARLAEVYRLMDEGVALAAQNKLAEATESFDKVLARAPLFDRRKEMVETYVKRARELDAKGQRQEALEMLRKALRLDPKGAGARKLEAEIATVEGIVLIDRGTPDKFILSRALELDPTQERAREALRSLDDKAVVRQTSMRRYAIAVGVGIAALMAMLILARRRPSGATERPTSTP